MPIGRAERILLGTVGVLIVGVVVAIAQAPHPTAARADAAVELQGDTMTPRYRVAPIPRGAPGPRDIPVSIESPAYAAPEHDTADIRARIAAGAPGTYLLPMLADGDWVLARWPDRRAEGLRVWVRAESDISGWSPAYAQMARDVFDQWGSSRSPLRFVYVLDSASADISLTWIDRFPPEAGRQIGNTTRQYDRNDWLVSAAIQVAVHDPNGRTFTPPELIGIVRHEAGHSLGLGHSPDTTSMMYPEERVHDVAPVDLQTLRLLYTLPPGSLRGIVATGND